MPQLLFYRDGREVLRFPLLADEIRLGRHSENDISLPDPEISRFHARITRQGDGYLLANISRVGTQLKGEAIDQVLLKDHDVFQVGSWQILYQETTAADEVETAVHKAETATDSTAFFCGIVGQSPLMKKVFKLVQKGADSALPIMIQGETGTGKELVAQAIHQLSGRQGPFVALNCGAISPNLIESELFGHERGAFTGAVNQHQGAFEQACRGTLFLDEIGELPWELQPKLLRVLEEGTFKRVGGTKELMADVRIVAATHRDLQSEIQQERFREDLFYRLMGLPIDLPPLRERQEDIPLLARYFIQTSSPTQLAKELSEEAMASLCEQPWRGNVRELKNVLARSLLLCSSPILRESDLHFLDPSGTSQDESLEGVEKEAIVSALKATGGNKKQAAERLGISKSTLFRKLKEYNLGSF